MQDFYRCDEGYAETTAAVQENYCKKLVYDMHYEAQIQSTINYVANREHRKISKADARTMKLTQQQYEAVKFNLFSK